MEDGVSSDKTSAGDTTGAKAVGEVRLGSPSEALGLYPLSQSLPVKLSRVGPEHSTHPVPSTQQSQCLMEKLGLLESFKQSATTDSDIAGSSGEAGLSWPRGNDVDSAAATAAALLAGEARPSRIVKYSVTSESEPELAESSDGALSA